MKSKQSTNNVVSQKSLEQRLFEAFINNRGIRLTAEDVFSLVTDDSINTRISNKACMDAGEPEGGFGDVVLSNAKTWKQFIKSRSIGQ